MRLNNLPKDAQLVRSKRISTLQSSHDGPRPKTRSVGKTITTNICVVLDSVKCINFSDP